MGKWEKKCPPQVQRSFLPDLPSESLLSRSVCRNPGWDTDTFHICRSITPSKGLFIDSETAMEHLRHAWALQVYQENKPDKTLPSQSLYLSGKAGRDNVQNKEGTCTTCGTLHGAEAVQKNEVTRVGRKCHFKEGGQRRLTKRWHLNKEWVKSEQARQMSTWISFPAEGTVCTRSCSRSPPGLFEEEWGAGVRREAQRQGADSVVKWAWAQGKAVGDEVRSSWQGLFTRGSIRLGVWVRGFQAGQWSYPTFH